MYSKLFAAYTPVIVIVIVIQYEFHNSLNALHNSLITLHNSCNSMQCITHIVYPEEYFLNCFKVSNVSSSEKASRLAFIFVNIRTGHFLYHILVVLSGPL